MRGDSSAKMHHAGEGVVGERALAQHLAARGGDLVVVLYRASAYADCSEQYAVLDVGRIRGKPRLWPYRPAIAMVEHASRAAHRALILMEVNSTPNPTNITDP